MGFEIKIESQDVQNALNDLLQRTGNLEPAMRGIAAIMESTTEGSFKLPVRQ